MSIELDEFGLPELPRRTVSLTSGVVIEADRDYIVGNTRGYPYSYGNVMTGEQYAQDMLRTEGRAKRCLDDIGAVRGVYMGDPDEDAPLIQEIQGGLQRGFRGKYPQGGMPAGLRIPSIFKNPNKRMDDYFSNIAYIKDNPQIVEFYGANDFEIIADGTYGNRTPSVTTTAKRNITAEHIDDRLGDFRFEKRTIRDFGHTPYLNMATIKAMRPVLDYIFYLETGGKILPDQTDEFYFVTEEQYFSTRPFDKDLVHYCMKRYNYGMIDVFRFLNYVFQFFFKRNPMNTSEFRSYSRMINSFVSKYYSK